MGTDLVPRLRKMARYGLHYSSGGGEYVALEMHFSGAPEGVLEVLENNHGYIRKEDALRLADGLERFYARLKNEDVRPLLGLKRSRRKLAALVPAIARDLDLPAPPAWLTKAVARMMSDEYWDWQYDFPHLILLCRKGGGFWWC